MIFIAIIHPIFIIILSITMSIQDSSGESLIPIVCQVKNSPSCSSKIVILRERKLR